MKIENVVVRGVPQAFELACEVVPWERKGSYLVLTNYILSDIDTRMFKLITRDYEKPLEMIQMWCTITADEDWWKDFLKYNVGICCRNPKIPTHTVLLNYKELKYLDYDWIDDLPYSQLIRGE